MKTIKSLTEAEIAELPTLPYGWKWARLGELVHEIVVGYVGPITQFLTDDINNGDSIFKYRLILVIIIFKL